MSTDETETSLLAPDACPDCGARIAARDALCDDWRDPLRSLGCPHCGLWLVRNGRTHVHFARLVPVLLVGPVLGAGLLALARTGAGQWWAAAAEVLAFPILVSVATLWVFGRCVRRVGPPLLPADGTRADLSGSDGTRTAATRTAETRTAETRTAVER